VLSEPEAGLLTLSTDALHKKNTIRNHDFSSQYRNRHCNQGQITAPGSLGRRGKGNITLVIAEI
jgi:hypothetical protein